MKFYHRIVGRHRASIQNNPQSARVKKKLQGLDERSVRLGQYHNQ